MKILHVTLCLSFVLQSPFSMAQSVPDSSDIHAELDLVESLISLEGINPRSDRFRQGLDAAIASYDGESPAEGRADRLVSALVRMQLLEESQAGSYLADVRTVFSGKSVDPAAIASLATRYRQPEGYAFTAVDVGCAMMYTGFVLSIVSIVIGPLLAAHTTPTPYLVPFVGGLVTFLIGSNLVIYGNGGCG